MSVVLALRNRVLNSFLFSLPYFYYIGSSHSDLLTIPASTWLLWTAFHNLLHSVTRVFCFLLKLFVSTTHLRESWSYYCYVWGPTWPESIFPTSPVPSVAIYTPAPLPHYMYTHCNIILWYSHSEQPWASTRLPRCYLSHSSCLNCPSFLALLAISPLSLRLGYTFFEPYHIPLVCDHYPFLTT